MGTTNLNRLKVVLFEQNKTGKWLVEQLGNPLAPSISGVKTRYSQTCGHLIRFRDYWMWTLGNYLLVQKINNEL